MSYVVLARKWRPMRFEDLVGQEHVARTLANAIRADRVAHAFLFTGVRGVGKTTSARILAKALNCQRPETKDAAGKDLGPTPSPCLECPACLEIAEGSDIDVREIDGASYNGVDEVRKLQESLPYRPSRDRYKIFIVDEVHMLSQSAWNAFLKTLEEPPSHVKFIFATTEAHKVPVTILSRVQRFDFRLIATRQIAERLRYVLGEEQIEADEAAVTIIAREAAGSMRDAMSLLDQVIVWSGNRLTGDEVAQLLGVANRKALLDLLTALVNGDPTACLLRLGALAEQGHDMAHVARDLLSLLRDLVVSKVCAEPGQIVDLPDLERKALAELAHNRSADDLLRVHQAFSEGYDSIQRSGQPRAAFEMLLVRLARRPPLRPLDDLIDRLNLLEQKLGHGGSDRPASKAPRTDVNRPQSTKPAAMPREHRSAKTAKPEQAADDRAEEPPVEPPRAVPFTATERARRKPEAVPVSEEDAPVATLTDTRPNPAVAVDSVEPGEAERARLEKLRAILKHLAETRPELAAFLEHAVPVKVESPMLVLVFSDDSVLYRQSTTEEGRAALAQAAQNELGETPAVEIKLDARLAAGKCTLSMLNAQAQKARQKEAISRAKNHPSIANAVEILGARLREVRIDTA